jgi:coproporphyrinogen III oxidase
MTNNNIKNNFLQYILELQNQICKALEDIDGTGKFVVDKWERPEGGGGISRIITNGSIFEKGGVNTSMVGGELPIAMQQAFGVGNNNFFACGLSLVIHPLNLEVF